VKGPETQKGRVIPPTSSRHSSPPCQYIRGQRRANDKLFGSEIVGRALARLAVADNVEGHFLTIGERAQASAFDGRDMNKHIRAAVIRLNKAEAFGAVEPLYSARSHNDFLSIVEFARKYFSGVDRYLRGDLAAQKRCVKGHKQYSMS
jgi:hypothetical protein